MSCRSLFRLLAGLLTVFADTVASLLASARPRRDPLLSNIDSHSVTLILLCNARTKLCSCCGCFADLRIHLVTGHCSVHTTAAVETLWSFTLCVHGLPPPPHPFSRSKPIICFLVSSTHPWTSDTGHDKGYRKVTNKNYKKHTKK